MNVNVPVVIALLLSAFTGLSGFLAGSGRFDARVAVLEAEFTKLEKTLNALDAKVDALLLRFVPGYSK